MIYEEILQLARRQARGESLSESDATVLATYLSEHPERSADIRFEQAIAATIAEQPVAEPSVDFVDAVMARLSAQPVVLPEPSSHGVWKWLLGAVGAGAGSAFAAWEWRAVWLGWLKRLSGIAESEPSVVVSLDWYAFLSDVSQHLSEISAPSSIAMILIAIGLFTWGAITYAEDTA
jgi:hypothetical protein